MNHRPDIAPTITGEPTPARVDKRLADIFAAVNRQEGAEEEWYTDDQGEYQRLKGYVIDTDTDHIAAQMVLKKYKPVSGETIVGKIIIRTTHSSGYARYDLMFDEIAGRYELNSMTDADVRAALVRKAMGRKVSADTRRVADDDSVKLVIHYLEHFEIDKHTS